MTVGHWSRERLAFDDGVVDLAKTIRNLKAAEAVLEQAVKLGQALP